MSSLGQQLKRQRESRGLDLDDVAEATKIARHHLEALEEGDLESLPGPIFNRGYVRAYAEFVGLDSERAVADYADEERSRGRPSPSAEEITREIARAVETRGVSPGRRLPLPPWVPAAAVGLVLLALVLGWLWTRPGQPPASRGPADVTAVGTAPEEPLPEEEPPTSPGEASTTPADATWNAEELPASEPRTPEEPRGPVDTVPGPGDAAEATGDTPTGAAAPVEPAATGEDTPPAAGTAAKDGAAPPEAGAASGAPSPPSATAIRVSESGVGTDVVDRRLVGRTDRFAPGSVAWFWTRVIDGRKGEEIRHVWIHEGREVATLSFTVGGPHWRVSSRKTLREGSEGRWAVEARDAAGRVLAREEFRCEAAVASPPADR